MIDAEPVVNSTFLTEDGEEKRETWPCNFVTDEDQASQLVAYHIWDSRELAPITLVCMPRLRAYRPGECLHLDLPELGLDTTAIILRRELDPATMKVKLELMGETSAKHAYCLGLTGTAPPTPAIGQTAQERDELAAAANGDPNGFVETLIRTSNQGPVSITATHDEITVGDHDREYADKSVAVTGAVIDQDDEGDPLIPSTKYFLYYDDEDRAGGAVSWKVTTDFYDANQSPAAPYRHASGYIFTDSVGGGGTGGGGSTPPGTGGGEYKP
ncbi:hypothetical protein A3711_09035 [Erythrobacter sp. HI00D59]|nr:hypothetical protein A3711_09035 [Erythrobacter sp. HI00D59]